MTITHRSVYAFTLVLALILFSGCSSNKDKAARGSELDLFQDAQKHLRSSSWEAAIQSLQLIEENYPFGLYADHAQLELVYAFFKATEHDAAVATADRFIRLHPQHRNVDYAYYMRGIASFHNDTAFTSMFPTDMSSRDPGSARESFNYFSQLLTRFPESPYAVDAQKRMVYLRNVVARYEIHVANYYFKRGAYLAAANRGRWVVENMQTTPAVPDGLAVMAQAYYLLGMQELSDDAVRVLKTNFNDHPALSKNGEFNYQFGRDKRRSVVSYLTLGLFDKRDFVNFDSRELYDPFYDDGAMKNPVPPPRPQ